MPLILRVWLKCLIDPPEPAEVRAALAPYAEAFDLVHPDLPAMQVRPTAALAAKRKGTVVEEDDEDAEPEGAQALARLLPDVPTVNNDKFRDWAGETTAHTREVIEAALAHQLKDKAEAAYARGDLFTKRRKLMEDWAAHLTHAEPATILSPGARLAETPLKRVEPRHGGDDDAWNDRQPRSWPWRADVAATQA